MTMPAEVPVRDAATVVLLRDGVAGIEAWMLTRVAQMAFAAGMSVFPGGRVEPADAALPLVGADVAALARRFGCDEQTAHALLGAAVRETYEETGVLLTVPAADLSADRAAVEAGVLAFGDLLRAHHLAVDGAALHPWARWVTPLGEPRRYDTRFFVGALPDAAEAQDVTTESSEASWVPVRMALEAAQRGERGLLPPTLSTLSSLTPFDTVAQAIAASEARDLDPVQARIRTAADGSVRVELPDGSMVPVPPGLRR